MDGMNDDIIRTVSFSAIVMIVCPHQQIAVTDSSFGERKRDLYPIGFTGSKWNAIAGRWSELGQADIVFVTKD